MDKQRVLRLDGAHNFRDIGGYRTSDGRFMKQGILFRSDELSRLSEQDLVKLDELKLKTIFDLRGTNERHAKPDRIPHSLGIRSVHVPIYSRQQDPGRIRGILWLMTGKFRRINFEKFVEDLYHEMAAEPTAQIGEIISTIAINENLPALIHCTGGKDRTGYLSALIQSVSGVPRDAILQDYLMTNECLAPYITKFVRQIRALTLFQISEKRIKSMVDTHGDYLEQALDAIDAIFGSVEGFLTGPCRISLAHIRALRELLVEDRLGQ